MGWLFNILNGAWMTFLVLAPLFLVGLLIGGFLNILLTRRHVKAMMGEDGLKSVLTSAAAGMPLPLCSCGVVPVAVTLGKKGASKPAVMSFLITTPESGADSVLVTWILMGPWVAIFRPFASLVTALLAGIFAIGLLRPESEKASEHDHSDGHDHDHPHDHDHAHAHDHSHGHDDHAHEEECCHDHDHSHSHDAELDRDYVGFRGLWLGLCHAIASTWFRFLHWAPLRSWYKPAFYRKKERPYTKKLPKDVPTLSESTRRVCRFAFIELADDILFSLVIGILLAGVIIAVFPDNLAEYGLGQGWFSYLVMLLAGIPLYMCASASTPVAAALVAKGLSPGAALVFLLSGPATNIATITTLTKQYGKQFVSIYLGSIAVGSLAAGLVFDWLVVGFGWTVLTKVSSGSGEGMIGWIQWISAFLLCALTFWRFKSGAALSGFKDLTHNFRQIFRPNSTAALSWQACFSRSRLYCYGLVALVIWLATGFFTVPPGHVAFGKRFGKIVHDDMGPGFYWCLPQPITHVDVWPAKFPFRLMIGLNQANEIQVESVAVDVPNTAPEELPNGSNQPPASVSSKGSGSGSVNASAWHGAGSLLAQKDSLAEFLAGDQNFVKILITVTYNISDPYIYYYEVDRPQEMIASAVLSSAREYVAHNVVDDLLSRNRRLMEKFIMEDAHEHLQGLTIRTEHAGSGHMHEHVERHSSLVPRQDEQHVHVGTKFSDEIESVGITLQSVNLIDIHPPEETIVAFRDVSSAMEDKHRSILEAEKVFTLMIPQATGNALVETKRAVAKADGRREKAAAESVSLQMRAGEVAKARGVLQDALWFETMERALTGRETFILPPGVAARDLTIWRTRPPAQPKNSSVTNEQIKAKNYP
jgi:uncharacterized protein